MNKLLYFLSLIVVLSISCTQEEVLSDEREISYFAFEELNPPIIADINQETGIISATIPSDYDESSLKPTITIPENASINPPSGEITDFSSGVSYIVTAESGKVRTYFAEVNTLSNERSITGFSIPELYTEAVISSNSISMFFPFGTDLTAVNINIEYSDGATLSIDPTQPLDLTNLSSISVTSEYGMTKQYALSITIREQETGVRGVWLTNVASNVLDSRQNIANAMQLLADLNFNAVFMVTWNKTLTPYQSTVLENAIAPLNDPSIPTMFYPGRDVLQEVIEEAHSRDLKVIAWFEYGFASQFGNSNGGRNAVLRAHPEWESRDQTGGIANKNNFYWMNAFHPEVQQFMTDLVLEVVNNYNVDGIQGDDRLPAVTSSSGYDDYTVQRYRNEHNGDDPPTNEQQQSWVQWRADILNDYADDLYAAVKAADPTCLVTFSPSPYTFSLFNYVQDWPEWVSRGSVEILSPQLYRQEDKNAADLGLGIYGSILRTNLLYANNRRDIFFPGVLLQVGAYIPSEEYLVELVRTNRENGVTGEVYFFFEGVDNRKRAFEIVYPAPAIWPTF